MKTLPHNQSGTDKLGPGSPYPAKNKRRQWGKVSKTVCKLLNFFLKKENLLPIKMFCFGFFFFLLLVKGYLYLGGEFDLSWEVLLNL